MLSLIVAHDLNNGIGINNSLPWRLSDDLQFFKKVTSHKTIIMGKTTFKSIGEKPLPNRRNIVLSRKEKRKNDQYEVYNSLESAIAACSSEEEVIIIGGGEVYKQCITLVSKMYITVVNTSITSDTFFPAWKHDNWKLINSKKIAQNAHNQFDFQIQIWEKNK
jgi:dihydrofolate reductase